jgi:PAS domain S-box-containing protein
MNECSPPRKPLSPQNLVCRPFGEQLFRVTFDCTSVGLAVVACDGLCLLANRALTCLLGYSLKDLLGTNLGELVYPEDRSLEEPLARQMECGILSSYNIKHRYRHKNGRVIWAYSYIALVLSGELYKCRVLQVQQLARLHLSLNGHESSFHGSDDSLPAR